MNKFEIVYRAAKQILETPEGKNVVLEGSKLLEETFPKATQALKKFAAEQTNSVGSKPAILKPLENIAGTASERIFVQGKPGAWETYEFKNSDNIPLYRHNEPRRFLIDKAFRTDGGKSVYTALDGKTVEITTPSLQELMHAPTEELTAVLALNQRQLLSSLSSVRPDEFPKLAIHGTDTAGLDFLFSHKASFSREFGGLDGLWVRTQPFESNSPQVFLNDTQYSIAGASNCFPFGHPTIDAKGGTLPHHLVVVDASKNIWNWDREVGKYGQFLTRPVEAPSKGESGIGLEKYVGEQISHQGKTQIDIASENFDNLVLGSFENTSRNLPRDVARNYFDYWKHERSNIAGALRLQEDTAHTFDLAGLLQRRLP